MMLQVVILAGGRGERFWPLSRRDRPKQLLQLVGETALLEGTYRRVRGEVLPERIWIVAGSDLRPALEGLSLDLPADRFLWEPVGRNTAAAIGAATERILMDGDADLLVLPSDHWIPDAPAFWSTVRAGRSLLSDARRLVTLGIPVQYPETGYGYIERGAPIGAGAGCWTVSRFHEKPDAESAERYFREGRCYWNSGIFLFRASTMAGLLRRHVAEMAPALDRLRADLKSGEGDAAWLRYFGQCPSVSIDHGVLERAESVAVVEAKFSWSDLGSWTSWGDLQEADPAGNRSRGPVLTHDSRDCIFLSDEGGLLAVLGVEGLIVVRVGNVTLVCAKDRAQEVKRLVQEGTRDERFRPFF